MSIAFLPDLSLANVFWKKAIPRRPDHKMPQLMEHSFLNPGNISQRCHPLLSGAFGVLETLHIKAFEEPSALFSLDEVDKAAVDQESMKYKRGFIFVVLYRCNFLLAIGKVAPLNTHREDAVSDFTQRLSAQKSEQAQSASDQGSQAWQHRLNQTSILLTGMDKPCDVVARRFAA